MRIKSKDSFSHKNETDKLVAEHLKELKKELLVDEEEFSNKCLRKYRQNLEELSDQYQMFVVEHATELDPIFDKENDDKTSMRGFKVRGCYAHSTEAKDRAEELKVWEKKKYGYVAHHIYSGPLMGKWVPWNPDPDAVQDSEYALPALNQTMTKYHENRRAKDELFAQRNEEMMKNAEAENKRKKRANQKQKIRDKNKAKKRR